MKTEDEKAGPSRSWTIAFWDRKLGPAGGAGLLYSGIESWAQWVEVDCCILG